MWLETPLCEERRVSLNRANVTREIIHSDEKEFNAEGMRDE